MANPKPTAVTGTHGAYLWLTTAQHDLDSLLRHCPQALSEKYIAVTSLDSGPLVLTDEEKSLGWRSRNGIAYSPQILSVKMLPSYGQCAGFDEWYVFKSPSDLGQLSDGNVFKLPIARGQVFTFVNFPSFVLHDPEVQDLVDLFWKQLDWVQPESYVADGDLFLTFVSRNEDLFNTVIHALSDSNF